MKKGGITRSTGFQVFLYFLLAAGALLGGFCIMVMVWLMNWGAYHSSFDEFEKNLLYSMAGRYLHNVCYDENSYPTIDAVTQAFAQNSEIEDVKYAIYLMEDNEQIWANKSPVLKGSYHIYTATFYRKDVAYRAELYLDRSYMEEGEIKSIHENALFWYEQKNDACIVALSGGGLALICLIWLMCNAGHGWHREGIAPGVLTNIYLDILTVVFGLGAVFMLLLADCIRDWGDVLSVAVMVGVVAMAEAVWCTLYLRELALRFKLGKWWQHTLAYKLVRLFVRAMRFLWKCVIKLVVHFPEIHLVIIGVFFLAFCEFMGLAVFSRDRDMMFILWFLEKLLVIPVVLYCALAFQKLRKGSHALAQGNLSQKLDTQYLVLHFKEHAEDLNQIGNGISKAVEQRLQSERLKTELITNVSHDLKTPLTSVINYADLLATAAAKDAKEREEQLQEYSEVLLRQSKRLKKLLEDLVEASKAATGNVELHPVPCELGVMLTQAAGEYEEKFAAKELKLLMRKPEEELHIMADGRQLWRVFENLLSNICKYAQEGSRVYLNMEQKEERVEIAFRNISKYELEISAEELTERFVRGDASRHMEGSGLGLSIAKSLVELQGGTMDIVTDGDLFKVVLSFELFGK